MILNELLAVRDTLKKFYTMALPYDLAKKVLFFLSETDYIEAKFRLQEINNLKQYAELDENGEPKINLNEDKTNFFYSLKKETEKEFFDKMKELLDASVEFHIDDDMYLTEDEEKTLMPSCSPMEIKILQILRK